MFKEIKRMWCDKCKKIMPFEWYSGFTSGYVCKECRCFYKDQDGEW